jgi:benzodiazapine receptor
MAMKLVVSLALCLLAGVSGSFFTAGSVPTWYAALNKPAFNPPNWVFSPVWTILYLMMGFSLFLVWRRGVRTAGAVIGLAFFLFQLCLNIAWSYLFFALHSPFYAFIEIVILWLAIVITIILFYRLSRPAAWLLIPYLLWVSFAAVLNFAVWGLN